MPAVFDNPVEAFIRPCRHERKGAKSRATYSKLHEKVMLRLGRNAQPFAKPIVRADRVAQTLPFCRWDVPIQVCVVDVLHYEKSV